MKFSIIKTLAVLAVLVFSTFSLSAAEVVTYYHNDHLGSPIAATDSTGAVIWQQAYDPWGLKLTSNTDARGYTGNWLDEGTGLADHKARWYTSSIGRFTAIDPVKWHESNIHSFNRYAYSGNNPYTNTDVDGDLFLSFHLNRRNMSTEQAILAGQVGNAGAETAMKLYAAAGGARIAAGSARSTSIIASTIVKRGYQRLADSLAQLIKPIGLSKKGIKHASKHLPEFKELDNSFTLDKLLRLGQRIARNEKNLVNSKTYGSKTYQATVRVGKKDVSVKSVLNASGNLRSVHIAK